MARVFRVISLYLAIVTLYMITLASLHYMLTEFDFGIPGILFMLFGVPSLVWWSTKAALHFIAKDDNRRNHPQREEVNKR